MADSELRIRSADPGDVRFVAWVIQEAARSHLEAGVFDLSIPEAGRRIDFLAALANSEARSFFHHSGFLIAEIDGRAAAALSGYEPAVALGQVLVDANLEALDSADWNDEQRALYGQRMQLLSGPMPDTPEDRWVIEWVATAPEFRGRGLVRRLLQEILERGRARGYRGAQISYLIGNSPARRAYEQAGFKTVDEKRDPDFELALGCPGIARMHAGL